MTSHGNNDERLTKLKSRLEKAYAAEERALEMQVASNAEGEQSTVASLSSIRVLIKDLEDQIAAIEGSGTAVTMAWEMRT